MLSKHTGALVRHEFGAMSDLTWCTMGLEKQQKN